MRRMAWNMKSLSVSSVAAGLGALLFLPLVAAGCAEEAPRAPGVDCSAHAACGVDGPRCGAGEECISIPGCASASCIDTARACLESCGAPSCLILESFPAMLRCEGGPPAPGRNGEDPVGEPELEQLSCEELRAERAAELAVIQACTADADCGQALAGTSCGCTRNLVARSDAGIERFGEIQAALGRAECGSLVTTCDCPAADGFACVEGRCTWNYLGVSP